MSAIQLVMLSIVVPAALLCVVVVASYRSGAKAERMR
jgi:hypothetical protein